MREFSEPRRVGFFFIYLIPALLFFLMNGGIFMFGQARQSERATPRRTQWGWWVKVLYAGLAGLVLVLLWFLTWFYRRIGRIYLGALMVAALATWFMVAGTIIGI